eukprot:g32195.t1
MCLLMAFFVEYQASRNSRAWLCFACPRILMLSELDPNPNKENHQFDWDNIKILGQAKQRQARELLEAWYSTKKAINKHIELDPIY